MIDVGFPVIRYPAGATGRHWGLMHGETFREAIAELAEIRRELMRQKNPGLSPLKIAALASEQWTETLRFDQPLAEELSGIADGAKLPLEELIVLNNYTDFRDIFIPDEGCSVVYVNHDRPIAGQTWDMHRSAKNYACCLHIPAGESQPEQVVFSLVGCVGLMGYSARGLAIEVNNINTSGARAGVVWPVLVRKLLRQTHLAAMRELLLAAPVTSGHTYLLASAKEAEFWEVMPDLAEKVSQIALPERGHLFHTNHCLAPAAKFRELPAAVNSTTHIRFGLLEKKIGNVRTFDDVHALLNDHENYPKSICCNFQTGAQDPAVTCGGAVGDLESGRIRMWRGDAMYDDNFVRHDFELAMVNGG